MIRILEFGGADAQKFASALSNKTAKKILDYLETHTATATQIAKALKLSPSTVHYNLELLKDCGLIIVEGYNYSQKGKEVLHYTLTKDHIVIAPRSDETFLTKLRAILPILILGFLLLAVSVIPSLIAPFSGFEHVVPSIEARAVSQDSVDVSAMTVMSDEEQAIVVPDKPALNIFSMLSFIGLGMMLACLLVILVGYLRLPKK